MEMTLLEVMYSSLPIPFFSIKKKHQIVIKLTITLSAAFRICWLKSEKSEEVSAHLNYLHANFKDIQF